MFETQGARAKSVTSRTKRVAVFGAAVALLISGGTVALSQTSAFATSASTITATSAIVNGTGTTVLPGQQIRTSINFTGLADKRYQHISKLVDKATGQDIGSWVGAPFSSPSNGTGAYAWNITVPAAAAGKDVVVFSYIFDIDSVTGTTYAPTGIKPGFAPVLTMTDINSVANTFKVGGATATGAVSLTTATPTAAAATTTATSTTIATVATDKADGDKTVAKDGIIVDVVTYTGLNPGSIYVLHTQLFNKTDNVLTSYTQAKIFTAKAANGTETVEIKVPAGLEGKTLVVYQTIYNGNDAVVGKHLDKIDLRPGTIPKVSEKNPDSPTQTVTVQAPVPVCTISGYVWKDSNKNGKMDADEAKVPGVTADVRNLANSPEGTAGTTVGTATTDANGFYKVTLEGPSCGRLFVDWNEAQYPDGWNPFTGGESDLRTDNMGVNGGWSKPFNLPAGSNVERIDAGLRQQPDSPNGTIGGDVCRDLVLDNYRVLLFDATTNRYLRNVLIENNQFTLNDVAPGTYRLEYWGIWQKVPFPAIRTGDLIYWSKSWFDWKNDKPGSEGQWLQNEQGRAVTSNFTIVPNQIFHLNSCGYSSSPLALDLNNSGAIDTASVATQGASAFDLLQTGEGVQSGWLAKGDGFLAAPNADGTITSGANLFGGALGEGFAQLGSYDKDGNGVVSGAELAGLKVWVDANSDHVAQPSEIKNLSDYGITALNVAYTNSPVVNNGNVVVEHGTAVKADGSSVVLGDAYFTIAAASAANQAALAVQAAKSEAHLATLPAAEAAAIRSAFAGR